MYLLKSCIVCGKKLRFPIDRGKINVKCPCGYSFTADPDDAELYDGSKFDISTRSSKSLRNKKIPDFFDIPDRIKNIRFGMIYRKVLRTLIDFKYQLQNFKLLPDIERKKIILILMSAILIILSVFYFISG